MIAPTCPLCLQRMAPCGPAWYVCPACHNHVRRRMPRATDPRLQGMTCLAAAAAAHNDRGVGRPR
jgi:tRNA(Ile2) C34 agmatinyltransferase TiaS